MNKTYGDRTTEILTAVYVFVGIMLLTAASKLSVLVGSGKLWHYKLFVLIAVACAVGAAILTYILRRKVYATPLLLAEDVNKFIPTDWLATGQGMAMFIFGLVAIALPPAALQARYVLMLVIMTLAVSLNTYFIPYWQRADDAQIESVETLRLQHKEWSGLFASACIGFLVAMGGALYASFFAKERFTILDGILLTYSLLGSVTVWLFRPMYVAMVRIRYRIDERRVKLLGDNAFIEKGDSPLKLNLKKKKAGRKKKEK